MENRAIRFLNKFKATYYLTGLILIALTDHWINKLRNQTTYLDISYLPVTKFFPAELSSFIGILIVLRCFSLSRHGMVKCVASISIFTLLDWIAGSVDYLELIIRPTCFILQTILIAYRSYQFHRLNPTNLNIFGSSTVIIGFLNLSEISMGHKLYFTDHVKLVYLIAIMLPEGIIPSLTPEEKSALTSFDKHLSVFCARLHILKACSFFSMYWLLISFFKLINHDETWHLCGGIFGPKLESPLEVFAMAWVVTFITSYASNLLRAFLFLENVPADAPFLLLYRCQLFVFLLDDGIWNMEREQQWKTISLILFIPLIQILTDLENCSRSFIRQKMYNGLSVECAKVFSKVINVCIICPLLIIVWKCAWIDEFNVRSFFVIFLAFQLLGVVIVWNFTALNTSHNNGSSARHCEFFYAYLFPCLEGSFIITMMCFEILVLIYIAFPVLQLPGFFQLHEIGFYIWALWNRWGKISRVLIKFWRITWFMYGLEDARGNGMGLEERGVCTICQQDMEVACITRCSHYFHRYCLEKYLYSVTNNACSNCRKPLLFI